MTIRERFNLVCKRPLMYAATREALIAIFSTLLELDNKDGMKLYDLLPRKGALVLTTGDKLDNEFAELVITTARQLLVD
jgi:hypothetical protein